MKKLLASLLAIVMALSLAVPAFADGPDGPPPEDYWENAVPVGAGIDEGREWEELAARLGISVEAEDYYMEDDVWEWIAAHEEQTKEFLTSGMDAYLKRLGYESLEYFNGDWLTPDGAVLNLLGWWVWEQQDAEQNAAFRAEHPDLVAQFEANAYDWFAENNDWCPSAEEYMKYMELTQAEFVDAMVDEQIRNYFVEQAHQEWLDAFEASHPGMLAWFEANAYDYFTQNYGYYYASVQAFMDECGYTEEQFVAAMVDEQIDNLLHKEEQQEQLDKEKAELGGVPGQVGVMIDGKYIQFPDAVPELVKGRTMVPLRAIMEALGAEVAYGGNDDIRCTAGGFVYTFAIGSSTVTVRPTADNGADVPMPEDIVMDCAPYIKNGRTYVPVRFFAEALGYTVVWDGDFKTAVLIDMDSLIEGIDKNCTLLNGLLQANRMPDLEQYRLTASLAAAATRFDSLDGDRTGSMSFNEELLVSPEGLSGTVEFDMVSMLELMEEEYGAELLGEESQSLLSMMSGKLELRVDTAGQMLYFSMPSLNAKLKAEGADIPADAWFSLDMSSTMSKLILGEGRFELNEQAGTVSMGTRIADYICDASFAPVYWYSYIQMNGEAAVKAAGDAQFTREGDVRTITLDAERMTALFPELMLYGETPQECTATLTVHDGGAIDASLTYRTPKEYGYGDSEDMRVTLSGSVNGLNTDMKMEIHLKNQFKLSLDMERKAAGTSQQPQTDPPEGAVVIPVDKLSSYYGGELHPGLDGLDPDFTIPMEPAS